MPQRYYIIEPVEGANLYQGYTDAVIGQPTILGPSQLAELGLKAGIKYNGNLNTTWMFVNTGTASPVVNAGTAVPISATTFVVQSGTSTLNGTSLVGMPASTPGGLWLEISGATLNLTPAGLETEEEPAAAEHPVAAGAAAGAAVGAVAGGAAAATTATPQPGAHAPAAPRPGAPRHA